MPKAKPIAPLSGLLDTDMEDDALNQDAFPTPDSNQENVGLAKKKGRPTKAAAKKITKPKASARRTSGRIIAPKKASPKKAGTKRAPLKEQTNVQHAEDTEEVDEFVGEMKDDMAIDELDETQQPPKRKAAPKKAGKQPKKKPEEQMKAAEKDSAQQPKAMEKDGEFEYTPTTTRQTKRPGRPAAQKPRANMGQTSEEPRQQEKVIPETQVAMEIDQSESLEVDAEDEEAQPQSVFRRTNNAREKPHQRQPVNSRRRAGSASENEGGGSDAALRRKLGEMNNKFEKLETKYKTLREEGILEANANFEKYKTASQANAKGNAFSVPFEHHTDTINTSRARPHRLAEERARHPKSAHKRLGLPRQRDRHP